MGFSWSSKHLAHRAIKTVNYLSKLISTVELYEVPLVCVGNLRSHWF
jgi:hypothetical protein